MYFCCSNIGYFLTQNEMEPHIVCKLGDFRESHNVSASRLIKHHTILDPFLDNNIEIMAYKTLLVVC